MDDGRGAGYTTCYERMRLPWRNFAMCSLWSREQEQECDPRNGVSMVYARRPPLVLHLHVFGSFPGLPRNSTFLRVAPGNGIAALVWSRYSPSLTPTSEPRTRRLPPVHVSPTPHSDPWPTVALAFFLRYPNRYASHVLSCDVIDRHLTPSGTLRTTRLILKRGALPTWFPRGIVQRGESWIVEESEVDVSGKILKSMTRNLDHVKALQVLESQSLHELPTG